MVQQMIHKLEKYILETDRDTIPIASSDEDNSSNSSHTTSSSCEVVENIDLEQVVEEVRYPELDEQHVDEYRSPELNELQRVEDNYSNSPRRKRRGTLGLTNRYRKRKF